VLRVRVKICGVRSLEEARLATELGADALGFNFWEQSPRYIDPDSAAEIVSRLPPLVTYVGVFVNESPHRIADVVSRAGLDAIQLHGDEDPEFCASLLPLRVIKAVRVQSGFDAGSLAAFKTTAILLDTGANGLYGGSGHSFDWSIAVEAKRFVPVILAGGLSADNVERAIRTVRPLAVDVCSGVEAEPGRKDPAKLRAFINAVARANSDPDESYE
jgi:phosphoribosylanthranilate isomerase